MMGSWFLATAYSEYVAVQLAKLASVETVNGAVTDVAAALANYTELFTSLLYIGLAFGVLLLLLSPLLKKMMQGVH
jgi:POT family proton-dependent oligopeptide transporter